MTAKERANSIAMKFDKEGDTDNAIKCAIICVNEIINSSPSMPIESEKGMYSEDIIESTAYWMQVKNELEKL